MTSLEVGPAAARPLQALVPLLTRLVVAQVFILSGVHKLEDYGASSAAFATMGIPAPDVMAGVVAVVEIAGGAAVLLGLFTRFAAFLLCGVMVVALATAHAQEVQAALVLRPEQGKGLASITAVVMLGFLGWLLAWGPGPVSIDRLRLRARARRREDEALRSDGSRVEARSLRTTAPEPRVGREKIEPSRARAEREHMLPSRSLGPREGARRSEAPAETGGPLSGRLPPESPPDVDAPGTVRL